MYNLLRINFHVLAIEISVMVNIAPVCFQIETDALAPFVCSVAFFQEGLVFAQESQNHRHLMTVLDKFQTWFYNPRWN